MRLGGEARPRVDASGVVDLSVYKKSPSTLFGGSLLVNFSRWSEQVLLAVGCVCFSAAHADTRHARVCPREGDRTWCNISLLIHTMFKILKRLCIADGVCVGGGVGQNAFSCGSGKNAFIRMENCCPLGELREASIPAFRHKDLLIDGTYAVTQKVVTRLRNRNADGDGSAANIAEAPKDAHYARPGQFSSDKRGDRLNILVV